MSDSGSGHHSTPFRRFFFLDVLSDKRARPVLIYAGISIAASAVIYRLLEGWSWTDSFYFVIITFATIGYGDLVPTTPFSKIVTMFASINGVIILLMVFDTVRQVRHWQLSESSGDPDDSSED